MSLESGIRFLMAQDLESLIRLFWFTTLLEFPRFMIAAVVAAGVALAPKSRNEPKLKGTPLVSVLLPTHNGAKTLSKTVI